MAVIAVTTIPGWPSPVVGVMESLSSLMACSISPDGLHVADGPTATTFLNTYVGSATELSWNKTQKQIALDALLDNHFDLTAFIRAGTVTTLTATNIGTFLATISNNYRTLRASIAAAADLTTLNAININAGWPSNT